VLSALALATGVPASPLVPTVATPHGYHRRETVSAEVVDLAALVAAVSAGAVPLDTLRPHQPALNKIAREQGELFAVPGCTRVVTSRVVSR
jgi:hypothetical protein